MRRHTLVLLALVALPGCDDSKKKATQEAAAAPTRQEAKEAPAPSVEKPAGQGITLAEALAAATRRQPDAPAIEVEIEEEEGKKLLEVEFIVGDAVKEVYLDPGTGDVVKEKDEELTDEEKESLPKLAKALQESDVKLEQMIAMATSKYDEAKIREIEIKLHDGKLIMEVSVAEGDEVVEWMHDPRTGDSLGKETEEEHEEGEEQEDDED